MPVCLPILMLPVAVNGFAVWSAGALNSPRCCLHVTHTFMLKYGASVKHRLWG